MFEVTSLCIFLFVYSSPTDHIPASVIRLVRISLMNWFLFYTEFVGLERLIIDDVHIVYRSTIVWVVSIMLVDLIVYCQTSYVGSLSINVSSISQY